MYTPNDPLFNKGRDSYQDAPLPNIPDISDESSEESLLEETLHTSLGKAAGSNPYLILEEPQDLLLLSEEQLKELEDSVAKKLISLDKRFKIARIQKVLTLIDVEYLLQGGSILIFPDTDNKSVSLSYIDTPNSTLIQVLLPEGCVPFEKLASEDSSPDVQRFTSPNGDVLGILWASTEKKG